MSDTTQSEALFRALQGLLRALKIAEANGAEAAASRLPSADLQALMLIGDRERCIVSDVAHGLAISPTTASSLVDRLVRNGYVERYRTDDDRRIVRLELTADGARIRDEAIATQLRHCGQMLDILSEAEAAEFLRLLRKMADGLAEDVAASAA